MKSRIPVILIAVVVCLVAGATPSFGANVRLNYQGNVIADGTAFDGVGNFRFAIVDRTGLVYYWTNDGNTPPTTDVPIQVTDGLYHVILGNNLIMDTIDDRIFDNDDLGLRIWFDDGTNGLQRLSPDQPFLDVAFAVRAQDAAFLDGHNGAYYLDWDYLQDIPAGFADNDDDDVPDSDAEVPDIISISNGRLFAPAGDGSVGIGTLNPGEKLGVAGKVKAQGYIAANAPDNGLRVTDSADDGVLVEQAGSPSQTVNSTSVNGFEVNGAEGSGFFTGHADLHGFACSSSTYNGFFVNQAGADGLNIGSAGSPSSSQSSILSNGVEIAGAEGHGIFIGYANIEGIKIMNAGDNAIRIMDSEDYGVTIDNCNSRAFVVGNCGNDGVLILEAGSPSGTVDSTAINGFQINGVEGHGLFVGQSDDDGIRISKVGYTPGTPPEADDLCGVQIQDSSGYGIYVGYSDKPGLHVEDCGTVGVKVKSAATSGIVVDNSGSVGVDVDYSGEYGALVRHTDSDGVYSDTDDTNGNGLYTPDRVYAGDGYYPTKSGSFAVNMGNEKLIPGDIVALAGDFEEQLIQDHNMKVIHVAKADEGSRRAVIGVVESAAEINTNEFIGSDGERESIRSFRVIEGDAALGEMLAVTVFGPAAVNMSQDDEIDAGEILTVGDGGVARGVRTTEINGIEIAENTGIIGKAMKDSDGSGKVWVFLNCR